MTGRYSQLPCSRATLAADEPTERLQRSRLAWRSRRTCALMSAKPSGWHRLLLRTIDDGGDLTGEGAEPCHSHARSDERES